MHREIALAHWLLDRVHPPALALDDLEDMLWRSAVALVPKADVRDVLERLAADHVPLAAVSNAFFSGRVIARELERHGLLNAFRFVISSADLGLRKPHPAIFDTALSRLYVPAARAWFVGDMLMEDIVGANAAGLQAIWLSDDQAAEVPGATIRVPDWASLGRLYVTGRVETDAG